MRRKQLFAVLMAGSMAASLAACGKTDTKKTTAATEKKTEAATEKKTEAATEKKTEVATTEAKTEKATEKETEAVTEKETEAATEAKTEEASSEEATEAKTEEASSEEASSEEASSEDVSAQAETEEESSEVATEAKTEEASNEEVSIEEVSSEEASSEEASSEEASSEEASSEEASSEEASSEEATEEASSEEASSEEATEAESEEASSEEETEAETEEDIDGTGFKIGMVTDVGGVNDGSFNQSAWEGLQRAGEAFGCEVKYIESKGDADYVPNIESFLDEDYDLIVCVGYMIICTGYVMADAVRDAAELYPDQKFAIIDDASNADLDNVTCMMFEQEQASYLVGLAAGYTTESNIVGFVTGAANETMNSFGYGYCAGVLDANPDATILQYNANNFGDASGGKTAVNTMVTKGADVVFHAAGGTGIGVIDGCKENKIWAIGVDSDQSPLAPETILTSALKRVDNACYDATKKAILGTLEGGVATYDLAAGGVDIAPTTDNLSKDVLEKIEDAKKDIIAGDLVVPKNQEEFEEKYGDVYELD